MKIYKTTGDDGTTGLMYGKRVSKDSPVIEALCAIDEIVAGCGLIRSKTSREDLEIELVKIQEMCFRLGTFVATDPAEREKLDLKRSSITNSDVVEIENRIDELCETFLMPQAFVHPGDNDVSANCDMARVIVRRCEIQLSKTAAIGWLDKSNAAFAWLNRLSDYFYCLARSLEQSQLAREKPASGSKSD